MSDLKTDLSKMARALYVELPAPVAKDVELKIGAGIDRIRHLECKRSMLEAELIEAKRQLETYKRLSMRLSQALTPILWTKEQTEAWVNNIDHVSKHHPGPVFAALAKTVEE